eukprot:7264567-Alexandrium_andersonii.AAC.1
MGTLRATMDVLSRLHSQWFVQPFGRSGRPSPSDAVESPGHLCGDVDGRDTSNRWRLAQQARTFSGP